MPQDGAHLAGTNRSGAKRKRGTSTAEAETASTDTADGPGPAEAGSDQGEQAVDGQTGDNTQLVSEGDMAEDSVLVVPEGDVEGDSGKDGKNVVSPTNFDALRMPKTVQASSFVGALSETVALQVKIGKCLKRYDNKISELKDLEEEKEEDDSDMEEYEEYQAHLVKEF